MFSALLAKVLSSGLVRVSCDGEPSNCVAEARTAAAEQPRLARAPVDQDRPESLGVEGNPEAFPRLLLSRSRHGRQGEQYSRARKTPGRSQPSPPRHRLRLRLGRAQGKPLGDALRADYL